jgi:hypothetical protein
MCPNLLCHRFTEASLTLEVAANVFTLSLEKCPYFKKILEIFNSLHLQDQRTNQARYRQEAGDNHSVSQ